MDSGSAAGGGVFFLVWLAVMAFYVVAMWRIFTKAGEPGWASLIPVYNIMVLLRIAGRPEWWVLLFFIPLVNFFVTIIALDGLAKSFGKGSGFTLGLVFLGFIFLPVLAFGSARYAGPPVPAVRQMA